MNAFKQIPFLRILIPFVIGILFGLKLQNPLTGIYFLFFVLFAFLAAYYYLFFKKGSKTIFLVFCDATILVFGVLLVQQSTLCWNPQYYGKWVDLSQPVKVLGRVKDVPSEKSKTIKLHFEMMEIVQGSKLQATKGNLIVYVRKHASVGLIQAGQSLVLHTRLTEIEEPRNPGEFDYKRYLYNRQIYHIAFVDSSYYHLYAPPNASIEWSSFALICKQWIVMRLRNAVISQEAFSIGSALLTGFDEEIGQDIMRAFSHSGTLHVLSVSGLHTGLIYVFLSVIFDFFDRRKKHKVLKFFVLTLVLWLFAWITGMDAPVLRSVLMLSLFAIGNIFFRNDAKNQLNLLFVSAFVLLCYNPYFITEIGFQLSFSALFGLIVFEPFFFSFWQPPYKWTNWLWKSTTTSFAATLSTLPFTLYYFKQFPFWFFIANPVVIPASFLLLLVSVPALFHWKWVLLILDFITEKLLSFIHLFDAGPLTYWDGIQFNLLDVYGLVALLFFGGRAVYKRSFKQLNFAVLLFLFWQLSAAIQDVLLRAQQKITVYSVNHAFAYSVKTGNTLFYQVSESEVYERYIKPHAILLGNPQVISIPFNVVETDSCQFIFLSPEYGFPSADIQKPAYLVVSKDYPLKESELERFHRIRALIVDQSNRKKSLMQVEKLCRKFGLLCIKTQKEGAFIANKDEIENWR